MSMRVSIVQQAYIQQLAATGRYVSLNIAISGSPNIQNSEPNRGFLSKTEPNQFRVFLGGNRTKPKVKNQFRRPLLTASVRCDAAC